MKTDRKKRKLIFKVKTQATNSISGQGGYERHNTEVDERMHSEETKITYLIGEHLKK
jgi:hypothetical protein